MNRYNFKKNHLAYSELHYILSSKIDNISDFGEEACTYISTLLDDNTLIGISRFVNLNKIEKTIKNRILSDFQNIDSNNLYFLSGIWIHKNHRNKHFGRGLISIRLHYIPKNSIIISDIIKDSPLLNYYLSIGFKIIKENNNYSYIIKES